MKLVQLLNTAGINLFFLLLVSMVGLAWLFPEYGGEASPLPIDAFTQYGVSIIFFFYGLKISPQTLLKGLSHVRLHAVIQLTTFLLFPVVALLLYYIFAGNTYPLWWLGLFFLAALPSTVSSSVVMISMAGGNVTAGIFNASISSIIGIFVTPIWMSIFVTQTEGALDLDSVIFSLSLQVLLPLTLGLVLHRYLAMYVEPYKKQLSYFDQLIILLIVYKSFSESFEQRMFEGFTASEIFILASLMLAFFLFMVLLMQFISTRLRFSREDRITILFCGSKKSLVQGAVMGQVLFPNALTFGVILLPLMLYHGLQLLAGSIIAQRFAKGQA